MTALLMPTARERAAGGFIPLQAVRDAVLQLHDLPQEIDARNVRYFLGAAEHLAQLEIRSEADLVGEARQALLQRAHDAGVRGHVVDEGDLAAGLADAMQLAD